MICVLPDCLVGFPGLSSVFKNFCHFEAVSKRTDHGLRTWIVPNWQDACPVLTYMFGSYFLPRAVFLPGKHYSRVTADKRHIAPIDGSCSVCIRVPLHRIVLMVTLVAE